MRAYIIYNKYNRIINLITSELNFHMRFIHNVSARYKNISVVVQPGNHVVMKTHVTSPSNA